MMLRVIVLLCILCSFGCSSTDSGTIIWSQTSNDGLATRIVIENTFLYILSSDRSKYTRYGQWHIEKRSSIDGSLVSSFGNYGIVKGNDEDMGRSIDIAADTQYIYVIGDDNTPGNGNSQWRIEKRRASDGALVDDFGNHGVVVNNPTPYIDSPRAIAIDANFMYVIGFEEVLPGYLNLQSHRSDVRWLIEKRKLSDGSLASDFGDGGRITSNPNKPESGAHSEWADAIAIDADFMYVTGPAYAEKRLLADGSLSSEFGDKGIVVYKPGSGFVQANSLAIDGKYMYVVGHEKIPGSSDDHQWHIEKRTLTDGSLVQKFGENGFVINNPCYHVDQANAVVLDQRLSIWERIIKLDLFGNSQAVYIVGKDAVPGLRDHEWRIEKRRMSDGKLDIKFNHNGYLTINPSAGFEQARAATSDGDYIYVVGDDIQNGLAGFTWRIVKIKK